MRREIERIVNRLILSQQTNLQTPAEILHPTESNEQRNCIVDLLLNNSVRVACEFQKKYKTVKCVIYMTPLIKI